MRRRQLNSFALARGSIVLALVLAAGGLATARGKHHKPKPADDGLPTAEEVANQARTVFAELADNSDPNVRQAVFEGLLAIGEKKDTAQAVLKGLDDGAWPIRKAALRMALDGRDAGLRKKAKAVLVKRLASGELTDREQGRELLATRSEKQKATLFSRASAEGGPDARAEARDGLIALGGATAWKVIKAGLAEKEGSRERTQALAALKTFDDPTAFGWAMANLHASGEQGRLARRILVKMQGKRVAKKLEKALRKIFDKEVFAKRIDAAAVLSHRGMADFVAKALLSGVRYKSPEVRVVAWEGMQPVRDHAILGRMRARILANEKPAEADGAVEWLFTWARTNADPKVIAVLQEMARSDRRPLRMRAFAALTRLAHRPSVAIFESAMTEGQAEVRLAAAKGLAAVSRPGDEARLATFMRREPNVQVKDALIEAFAHIGTSEIIAPLTFVVTSPQSEIKLAAVRAVAATGKPKAAQILQLLKRDPDLDVRYETWQALLRLDPKRTAAELPSAVAWLTAGQVEKLAADKRIGVEVLGAIAEKGSDAQRVFAVDGLRARGDSAATRLLSLAERSPHADTAAQALAALAEIRKEASVATYRAALENVNGEVRAAAYVAIGRFGPRQLLEVALAGLSDKDPLARARAAEAALRLVTREA